MHIKHLDLTDERCPMSLLLVKRAYKSLDIGEAMSISLMEPQSITDICAYLGLQRAKISKKTWSGETIINVLKQDD